MAIMDDIIKQQEWERSQGIPELRAEIERMRMTLRDQIAIAVLPAIITLNGNSTSAEEDAVIAYNYATAMLKTRGGSDE